jgi:hypothetical protein
MFSGNTAWSEGLLTFIDVGGYYTLNNVLNWMYGYKYWVMARTVPAIMEDDEPGSLPRVSLGKRWTESDYDVLGYIGLGINLLVCLSLGASRVVMNVEKFNTGDYEHWVGSLVLGLYLSMTFLLILSAVLIADALRRITRDFQLHRSLNVNKKTLSLHMAQLTAVSVIQALCMFYFQITRFFYIKYTGTTKEDSWTFIFNTARLGLYVSGVVAEMLVIKIFIKVAKPADKGDYMDTETSSLDYEEEDDLQFRATQHELLTMVKTGKTVFNRSKRKLHMDTDARWVDGLDDLIEDDDTEDLVMQSVDSASQFEDEYSKLTTQMTKAWGEEEAMFRSHLFLQFLDQKDMKKISKKVSQTRKKNRDRS